MKRFTIIFIGIFIFTASHVGYGAYDKNEKEAIENTVYQFMERCMNNFEVEAVEKCFHPDFIGLSMENDSINTATRSRFIDYVTRMKNREHEGREAKREKMTAKILSSNIVKEIGFVEFETYRGNDLLGTDFIVLLKSEGVWKFVRSVTLYHSQEEKIDPEPEKEKIKKVITESLVSAAGNYWDLEKWKKGFHPEFTGLTLVGTELEKDTYSDWEKVIGAMEIKEPEGHKVLIIERIPRVDVLGHMGIAEVKIYNGTNLSETTYILLIKFSDGWKVVSKVGLNHNHNVNN